MVQSVAIIGAGGSGLASIKCCLDEGPEPTCFEKNDSIGGIWKLTETPEEGRITIYRSVISNTSKEMSGFSDFPFPGDFPNYLRHSKLLDYLRMYAENFHLLDYIHFKTTVCSVRKQPDFTTTGQWLVVTETNGERTSTIFDGIMVCTGSNAEPNLPLDSFPGIENFQGRYLHSWEYRDHKPFEGEKVLVVGTGNTGADIAVEIGRTDTKVLFSTRTGTWVKSRVSGEGWPLDMNLTTRFMHFTERILPTCIMKWIVEKEFGQWFNHENFGLTPVERGIPIDKEMITYISYTDEIADCIGVKPNVPWLFLSDIKLALEVFFGPCTSYQYRLTGPGKWKEARSAILTQWDRALKPLRTRVIDGFPQKLYDFLHG